MLLRSLRSIDFSVTLVTSSILGIALLSWVALMATLFTLWVLWLCSSLASLHRRGSFGSFLCLHVPHFVHSNGVFFSSQTQLQMFLHRFPQSHNFLNLFLCRVGVYLQAFRQACVSYANDYPVSQHLIPQIVIYTGSTRPYNTVMYCSADSPSHWRRRLKHALSSITFCLTLKNPSNFAITSLYFSPW